MKICPCCKAEKDFALFDRLKRSKDGYSYRCKACQAISSKKWTTANWDKKVKHQANRRNDLTALLRAYKQSKGCLCCSETDPVCLEFHHLDPSEKEIDPSNMAGQGWAWERMVPEIEKCVVLCSNCHKKVHAERFCLV